MEKIKIVMSGLPGKMATAVAEAIANSDYMELLPYAFTGPEITDKYVMIGDKRIELIHLDKKIIIRDRDSDDLPNVIVDFSHPSAIEKNVIFYSEAMIPFVMGTTGGDTAFILERVQDFSINAVLAPNMAKEIVAFQAMMEFAANSFPNAFKGYSLEVVESHQKTKADTSGTAKAIIASFNQLGIPFTVDQIQKKRSEEEYTALGIPSEHWNGHGWHTYTLKKEDGSVFFQFTHNVNGRQAYIDGVLEAIKFLNTIEENSLSFGCVYSMVDILQANYIKAYQK